MTTTTKTRRRALTDAQRVQVIARWFRGATIAAIAAEFKVGEMTIGRLLRAAGLRDEHRNDGAGRRAIRRAVEVSVNHADDYQALGTPPADPLEAYVWALQALQTSLFHVIGDSTLDERARRREMREITRAMAALEPKARIFEAEALIRGDSQRLAENSVGPEMEEEPPPPPGSGRAAPKRGRPRR
jgi:hypothetical protein